jgi:hypothetical protein
MCIAIDTDVLVLAEGFDVLTQKAGRTTLDSRDAEY